MPAHQRQIGDRQRVIGAVGALADAHAPIKGGSLGIGIHARRLTKVIGRHSTNRLRPFRRTMLQRFDIVLKAFGARFDERRIEAGSR